MPILFRQSTMRKNISAASAPMFYTGFLGLALTFGCQLSTGNVVADGMLGVNQPVHKTVASRQITRQELDVLIRNQRHPDLLIYEGSKDGFDYFASEHISKTGCKPNEHVRFEDSDYWIPSAEVDLPKRLPYGQRVCFDLFIREPPMPADDM